MLFNKGERYALTECNLMLLRGMAPKKLKSVATGVEGRREQQVISENWDSNGTHY